LELLELVVVELLLGVLPPPELLLGGIEPHPPMVRLPVRAGVVQLTQLVMLGAAVAVKSGVVPTDFVLCRNLSTKSLNSVS
jgi:hypothetical protein